MKANGAPEQYIDKSSLVAEIEKWMTLLTKEKNQEGVSKIDKLSLGGRIAELQEVKVFIDTLEVKEVDLEKEVDEWMKYGPHTNYPWCTIPDAIKITAEHFFELGLKAQKGEKV